MVSKTSWLLVEIEFQRRYLGWSIFVVFINDNIITFFLVYVDDIISISSSPEFTTNIVQALSKEFPIKDSWELHYFLGIYITRVKIGLFLGQQQYAANLLHVERLGNLKCNFDETQDWSLSIEGARVK